MALLPNGNALAAGGYIGAFSGTTAADVYNYTSNVWNCDGAHAKHDLWAVLPRDAASASSMMRWLGMMTIPLKVSKSDNITEG